MTIDDVDSECPECGENAAYGECRCDGGDLMNCGVERFIEFREAGRTKTLAGPGASSPLRSGARASDGTLLAVDGSRDPQGN